MAPAVFRFMVPSLEGRSWAAYHHVIPIKEGFQCGAGLPRGPLSLPVFGEGAKGVSLAKRGRVGLFGRDAEEPHPAARYRERPPSPKTGLPDFGAKHVEFGNSRIRLDGEG